MNKVYVFGAHSRGLTTAKYLEYMSDTIVLGFLFDNDEYNETIIEGKPVYDINKHDDLSKIDISCPVYIGTRGQYFDKITSKLEKIGFDDIRPVTVDLDIVLRTDFLAKYYKDKGLIFNKLNVDKHIEANKKHIPSSRIYVAVASTDKKLEESYKLADYESVIQVGAKLNNTRIDEIMGKKVGIFDDDGLDTISTENRRLCELTGIYYIWKNIVNHDESPDIIGYCHYRRHFLLPDNWQMLFADEERIDVLLPTPLFVTPSLAENFKFRHHSPAWDAMMTEMKERYPEYYDAAVKFFDDGLYSPCNMFVTRKEIFIQFCEWIFPILFKLISEFGTLEDEYQNRYAAFIAERLMSFYFSYHSDKYKILYADKNFLK